MIGQHPHTSTALPPVAAEAGNTLTPNSSRPAVAPETRPQVSGVTTHTPTPRDIRAAAERRDAAIIRRDLDGDLL